MCGGGGGGGGGGDGESRRKDSFLHTFDISDIFYTPPLDSPCVRPSVVRSIFVSGRYL